jgi:hypothetical protein
MGLRKKNYVRVSIYSMKKARAKLTKTISERLLSSFAQMWSAALGQPSKLF